MVFCFTSILYKKHLSMQSEKRKNRIWEEEIKYIDDIIAYISQWKTGKLIKVITRKCI